MGNSGWSTEDKMVREIVYMKMKVVLENGLKATIDISWQKLAKLCPFSKLL
jgi:hypothetical protein